MKYFHPSLQLVLLKGMTLAILSCTLLSTSYSQCITSQQFYAMLINLEKAKTGNEEKLIQLSALKNSYEKCRLPEDSVYARILHRMGVLNYSSGNMRDAIIFTTQSVRINTNGKKSSNRKQALSSYYNLGIYYQDLNFYNESIRYLDTCISEGSGLKDSAIIIKISSARQKKGFNYYQLGDYQKDIAETKLGLKSTGRFRANKVIVDLLQEQAQSYAALQRMPEAIACLDQALQYIADTNFNAYADNHKMRAAAYEADSNFEQASLFYKKAIEARTSARRQKDLSRDYLDAGNFAMNKLHNYPSAKTFYLKSLTIAQGNNDIEIAGKILNNIGLLSYYIKNYLTALKEYQHSLLTIVPAYLNTDPLENPSYTACNVVNKVFLYQLLCNKTDCLLLLFKQTQDKKYLHASIQTAQLTDSVISGMRQEQTEDQSKLHWLADARDVFTDALEACYLSGNTALAFYFMEKSRSVLLNDKLNELGANATLPAAEAAREREYLLTIIAEQQELTRYKPADPRFVEQENKLLEAKDIFEDYVKALQNKYPAYYQTRYADDVPSFQALQKKLSSGNQCFIHYFISDTCIYILITTPDSGKFFRQSIKNNSPLTDFVLLCSQRQELNKQYDRFAGLANYLYNLLVKPLALTMKRVIICNDNYLLPFEALTTDPQGKDFLLQHYTFSYAYSARSLMRKFDNPPGEGACLLVAPASYKEGMGVSDLKQAQLFLEKSQGYYSNSSLLEYDKATKKSFLQQLPQYQIASIYSHASAGNAESEPLLYMQDSVIRLSELEMLYRPSTQLVILSACETSAGKKASGEGIYSLARGFAAAGIPAIATTLWKADENAMYVITDLFHQKISQGMRKDEALQQAKLAYMQQGDKAQMLPYYWATMILAGDADPIKLSKKQDHHYRWLYIIGALLAITAVAWQIRKKLKAKT